LGIASRVPPTIPQSIVVPIEASLHPFFQQKKPALGAEIGKKPNSWPQENDASGYTGPEALFAHRHGLRFGSDFRSPVPISAVFDFGSFRFRQFSISAAAMLGWF
jgi:hypothetical protein